MCINPEDENGNVVLSFKRAQEQISWDNVEKLLASDEVVDSKIIGFNKGGLIVGVEGLRGFVPSSQISAMRRSQSTGDTPEQRWQKMIGQPITVRVIEVDRERRRLILSERAASTESRQSIKERVIEELEEGKVYTGRVTSLADFGAFVNINGADGLVHLSELSWEHIEHPREVLEVGQEVKVKVINVDREKKRIGLSVRALQDDPWRSRVEKYSVGQLVEGVITRLTKFGAFARLEGDIEGLIHISEIAEHRIEHPKEVLKEGEVKSLRVIRIDPEQHRIGLSLRKVDSAAFADKDFKLLAAEYKRMKNLKNLKTETPETSELQTIPRAKQIRKTRKPNSQPRASRHRRDALSATMPLIIDSHQDIAWNMLTYGRDYTRSVHVTRRLEAGTTTPERNGDCHRWLARISARSGRGCLCDTLLRRLPNGRKWGIPSSMRIMRPPTASTAIRSRSIANWWILSPINSVSFPRRRNLTP